MEADIYSETLVTTRRIMRYHNLEDRDLHFDPTEKPKRLHY
jgi:hypothetical protein